MVIWYFLFRPLLRVSHIWFICCLSPGSSLIRSSSFSKGRRQESLYTCCSAAQLDRRSSGKSRVVGFSVTFGFATNKIVRDDSEYLHTQQCTQDYLELTESSRALRKLSARRLGKGDTLGRPTRRSSFLGHLRKLFFRHRMISRQVKRQRPLLSRILVAPPA